MDALIKYAWKYNTNAILSQWYFAVSKKTGVKEKKADFSIWRLSFARGSICDEYDYAIA